MEEESYKLLAELGKLEVNVEYMHHSTLMTRLTQLECSLESKLTNRLNVHSSWLLFELIMTASTIPNLEIIASRLKELAESQRRSTQRAMAAVSMTSQLATREKTVQNGWCCVCEFVFICVCV